MHLQPKKTALSWAALNDGGGDHFPLLSTADATPGVLGPDLGSSVQDRHGHIGESPAKGNKDG